MLLSKHRCKGKVAQLFFPLGSRLFWPRLLFGPYHPPKTRRGKFLFCERRGTVKVGDYSDGPIPWPVKWGTRNSLILCGFTNERPARQLREVRRYWRSSGTITTDTNR